MLSLLRKTLRSYNDHCAPNAVKVKHEMAVLNYGSLLPYKAQIELKKRIEKRLFNEDYTCRMPKLKKPVVRHKLRLGVYEYGGYVASVWR